MPTIKKGDLILVSGASGFIAAHVVQHFLKKGYKVRGTVRSKEKGDYLKDLFKGKGEFDYVLVDDITKDGIFDEAVKGVDAVAHTASPFHFNIDHPDQLIDPAVKGTTGILKSIQKNNPNVKRVVITSSVAAVMSTDSKPPTYHYTEKDFNEDSIPHVKSKGKDASPAHAYQASKTMAEHSLWDFIKSEKPSWEGAAINPPLVLGEVIHQCEKPEKLNTSVAGFYAFASGQKKESDLPAKMGNWVNVNDVAEAHVRALEVEAAGGQRFITSNGPFTGQDYCDILHKSFPSLSNVPEGKPNTHDEDVKSMSVFDGSHATDVLGIKYISLEETVKQMADSLVARGWLKT